MKAAITFVAAILVAIFTFAQAPCPQDTAINGGFPSGETQWAQGQPYLSTCPTCTHVTTYNCWQLLDSAQVVSIWGPAIPFPSCPDIEVRIVEDCRWVVKDTCLTLGVTGAGCYSLMDFTVDTNFQICIHWDQSQADSIGILAFTDGPTYSYPVLDSVIFDMDLCSVLNSTSQKPPEREPLLYLKLPITPLSKPIEAECREPWPVFYKPVKKSYF